MNELFWSCLIGGIVFSILSLVAGDIFEHGLDHVTGSLGEHLEFLNPTTIVSAIATFGGAGVLLMEYSSLAGAPLVALAGLIAVGVAIGLHFVYIRPMRRGENSVAFSMADFPGMIGSVTIAIPSNGYGEVMMRVGAGNTNQIAASHDGRPIRAGEPVVVVEVRDDTLFVVPLDEGDRLPPVSPIAPREHERIT